MSEFVLVSGDREDDAPKRKRRDRLTIQRVVTADGLNSLRVLADPLLGDCVAAFGSVNTGHASPFIARVLGPSPERRGRYNLMFLSSWLGAEALGGVGTASGFTGAAVVPVAELSALDCLDIRCGAGAGIARGYYLWVPPVGLDPLTELNLRWALVSPFRKGLQPQNLKGRGMAIEGVPEVPRA